MKVSFFMLILNMTLVIVVGAVAASEQPTHSQFSDSAKAITYYHYYPVGKPVLKDLWVDPVRGNDSYQGSSSKPFRTLTKAWESIPQSTTLMKTGYRINLNPGNYREQHLPANGWMESHYGSYQCPIIIKSATKYKANFLTSDILNFYKCRYLYLDSINIQSAANNVVHLEQCDHVLIRNVRIKGNGNIEDYSAPQEDLKANQCSNIFVEKCEISNAWNVPLDFVAVKNGHIIGNRIHKAGDWCIYLKGGSSHFKIAKNIIYDAKNGGFSAGQGSGFEFMKVPYIHYETYDIKFVNNLIHDTDGAGMGVQGSYNILLAYNTLLRVGKNSHALEFSHGVRSCDGNLIKCGRYLRMGGWGSQVPGRVERIPNKNVFVYNNIIYNPGGYRSPWSHISVEGVYYPHSGSNIPSPSRADDNLQIKGNIFWNGPSTLPLGIESVKTVLKIRQLRRENYFNTLKPQFLDLTRGNLRPSKNSNLYRAKTYTIPPFLGGDLPPKPPAGVGDVVNSVRYDFSNQPRSYTNPPGAFVK